MTQPQIMISGLGGTYDAFGLILTNASNFPEAKHKEILIDVPGRNGSIDLSESNGGDVAYNDVVKTMVFESCDSSDVRDVRSRFVNALSGKLVDYVCSWDPDYTRRGRWMFGDAEQVGSAWCRFTVEVRTDPYKRKPDQTVRIAAGGGAHRLVESGRMRVRPTFECKRPFTVSCNGVSATLPAGASKVRGIYFNQGYNDVYANSSLGGGPATWADLAGNTWGGLDGKTWADLGWIGADKPTGANYDVYVTYEWGDL